MALTAAELEQLLSLALAALRTQGPAGAAPLIDAVRAEQVSAPTPMGRTLGAWLDEYMRALGERGYKAQTLRNRKAVVQHVLRLWGEFEIGDLKPHRIAGDLRSFLPERSSTAVRVLSTLRDVYAEAICNGWCETNPASHVRPPVHRVLRKRLSFEVWQRMWEAAKAHPQRWLQCLLLLALVTGQRRADLAKMRFEDVVVEGGAAWLRVEQQKQAGKGYGARVQIPLALRLDAIGMTVGQVIEQCRETGRPGGTLLRKAGGGPIELSSLSARFAECLRGVLGAADPGANVRPSLHEVRSLSARLYRDQGVDVQTLLGHKNFEMTEVYMDDRGLSAKEWKKVRCAAGPV